MRTRSVLVSLNPDTPRPEERTGFAIPNLDQWILVPANQRAVLWHLLVLVADWTRQGAPRQAGLTMRQFTSWAEAVGGFLAHHDIEGFLANVETVRDIDDEESEWITFFAQWWKVHGDDWLTSNELRLSADIPIGETDPWDGLFLTDSRGKPSAPSHSARSLPVRSAATAGATGWKQDRPARQVEAVAGESVGRVMPSRGRAHARGGRNKPRKPRKPRSVAYDLREQVVSRSNPNPALRGFKPRRFTGCGWLRGLRL